MQTTPIDNVFLSYWTNKPATDPPTVAHATEALTSAGLNPERAEPVPDSTAFRRAGATLKSDELRPTVYTRKRDNIPCLQIDRETQGEDGKLTRARVSNYELSANVDETPHPLHVSGERQPDLDDAYHTAKANYTWADVSKVIKAILTTDGLGAYTPKTNGGVYFIPVRAEAPDMLDKIAAFASAVGVNFLTFTVPDVTANRQEIADSIAAHFAAEIQTHAEAIATYDHTTRPGILENRREAIRATDSAMGGLRHLTNGRFEQLRADMRALLQKIRLIETEIETRAASAKAEQDSREEQEQNERQQNGRRQIVSV